MTRLQSRQNLGFFSGIFLFLLISFLPTSESLSPAALHVAAIATLMAVWWVTEPVPIPVTALLPIALFPTLDVMSVHQVTSSYALNFYHWCFLCEKLFHLGD